MIWFIVGVTSVFVLGFVAGYMIGRRIGYFDAVIEVCEELLND